MKGTPVPHPFKDNFYCFKHSEVNGKKLKKQDTGRHWQTNRMHPPWMLSTILHTATKQTLYPKTTQAKNKMYKPTRSSERMPPRLRSFTELHLQHATYQACDEAMPDYGVYPSSLHCAVAATCQGVSPSPGMR
mmetsp:Transcript_27240/g.73604  ORF Transcript_27240/g.73604 Transcript_27240/m.73604 type:complete len:133 (-) Transcript_27240:818-1216(-)